MGTPEPTANAWEKALGGRIHEDDPTVPIVTSNRHRHPQENRLCPPTAIVVRPPPPRLSTFRDTLRP